MWGVFFDAGPSLSKAGLDDETSLCGDAFCFSFFVCEGAGGGEYCMLINLALGSVVLVVETPALKVSVPLPWLLVHILSVRWASNAGSRVTCPAGHSPLRTAWSLHYNSMRSMP